MLVWQVPYGLICDLDVYYYFLSDFGRASPSRCLSFFYLILVLGTHRIMKPMYKGIKVLLASGTLPWSLFP